MGRGWVNEEFAATVAGAAAGEKRLIPVLAGDVALPPMVAGRLYIDFRHADAPAAYEAKVRELAAAIRRQPAQGRPGLGETLVPPPKPHLALGTRAPARSAYLQQVRRIAPPDPPGLIGREAELAELAAFCVEPDRRSYVWWQAGPWAGKSALLSTFVLHLPPGAHVVSFFITARLAAQDTWEAFTQVLLEQLADLTGQELPPVLPEATREAYLLDLLDQAAGACREAGGRLVLVVDGLDEDRGVTAGPDAHSIAALLPVDPPAGMRVIVAGRSNPPIPDDVPSWHPLRDPRIIRPLPDSPYARDVQQLSRRELQRLLHGTPVEQDLLGLLTAARGGLSGPDLEELTGTPMGEIEEILHTVAGRTFTRRASPWAPATGRESYLLGHEELQAAAVPYFGQRLVGYHDRLHSWADTYRAKGWPPETPEYLLSGYFRLLVTLGDLFRMISCAGDAARHDRMLDLTGGDTAALAEIRTTLDLIATQDVPDLASALCLACHRDLLTDRNINIPGFLPAVWATLGQASRAEALATSITSPYTQATALEHVAEVWTSAGLHERAEAAARSITDPNQQGRVLARVAEAWARAGQHERAEAVAHSIIDPDGQASALAQVARTLAGAGQHEQAATVAGQAEAVARSVTDPDQQAWALAWVADALAAAGRDERAEAVASSITDPDQQAWALAWVAKALARAGQHERAAKVAARAQTVAHSIASPGLQANVLTEVAEALASAGQHERAEAVARSITDSFRQAGALTRTADALAEAGQHERAAWVAGRAEAVARSITDQYRQASALAQVAEALASAGQRQEAARVAGQAQAVASSITDPDQQAWALEWVAKAWVRAGQHERAEAVASSITDSFRQAGALTRTADALAEAEQYEQAARVAGQAQAVASSITDPDRQVTALEGAVRTLARTGRHGQAEAVASSITDLHGQAVALMLVAGWLARAGQHKEATRVAGKAEAVARSVTDPYWQASALAQVAEALARAGQRQQAAWVAGHAEAVARSITDPDEQASVLAQVAEALARAGQRQQAAWSPDTPKRWPAPSPTRTSKRAPWHGPRRRWPARGNMSGPRQWPAPSPTHTYRRAPWHGPRRRWPGRGQGQQAARVAKAAAHSITDPDGQASALAQVAEALASAGQHNEAVKVADQAEAAARSITDRIMQADALAQAAEALASAGQHERAEAVARSIADSYWQASALAEVAQALAKAGQHEEAVKVADQAEAVARSITDPGLQASPLVQTAEALAEAGNTHSARRLAAVICTVGEWTTCATPVLLLDPLAFAVLARVLDDRWRMQLSQL